jgi:hypothetical protein
MALAYSGVSNDSSPTDLSYKWRDIRELCWRYEADRARRTLRGIDEQVAKAEKAVAEQITVKRDRFIHLSGTQSVTRGLRPRPAPWPGSRLQGYVA